MASAKDIQKILHAYVKQSGNPRVAMEVLRQFAVRFAQRFADEHPDIALLLGPRREELLRAGLTTLAEAGVVQLEREPESTAVASVFYPGFFTAEITRWYQRIQDEKDVSFPSEEHLDVSIPQGIIRSVDVADNLMHWIVSEEEDLNQILLLKFPDYIREVVTTVKILRSMMLPLVLGKIRDYLRTDKNSSYMETKLRAIFRSREMLVHDQIEMAQTRLDDALQSVRKPNDFHFHFWTQMSSEIIKEYAQKTEKLDMEHGFCQAAYLLGYFSVHYKGQHQKSQQREATHKLLTDALQKPPFTFTVQDVYNITDDRGILISKKVSQAEINEWLEEMLKRPSTEKISELVTIDTTDRSGLMIHSRQYIPLMLRQIKAAAPVITRELTNEMATIMLDERTEAWLEDDAEFESVVAKRVREEFTLLYGLATFQTLFLVIDGQELAAGLRDSAMALIDRERKSMRPWTEILELDRASMYRDARLRLPVWMLIPIVRGIVRLFRAMFSHPSRDGTKRGAASSPSASTPSTPSAEDSASAREARKKKFQDDLAIMQQEFISSHQTPDQRLKELRQQWNPLIDPIAANNLVEDVNALCRDTLRRMRYTKTLEAPNRERIQELASRIAANTAFERIRRRKAFETYLKLYLLTVLQRM